MARSESKRFFGCESGKSNGIPFIKGWIRTNELGFVTFHAHPLKDSKKFKSESGISYSKWIAYVTLHRTFDIKKINCLYDHNNGKLRFPDFNMVANPDTNYFGTSNYKK